MLFQPYAEEVARRALRLSPQRILETAAGTGIVTAELHRALPDAEIVATDLNPAMLELAAEHVSSDKVGYQAADALHLPFADASFDLVVCQFGVMFYPDKVRDNREARRVLRDGGKYLILIWDRLDRNPVSEAVNQAVAEEFPADPPRFLERAPFGYWDPAQIEADLRSAGFTQIDLETVGKSSVVRAEEAATGLCRGSPLCVEILERDPAAMDRVVDAARRALQRFDGTEAPMSAHVVTATR